MLEEQHEGIPMIPASRTHSNSSSQNGQHTSASSTASLTSSLGSSLASSLGSTGSGTGGKVRQMFEERRNNINGRPPAHGNGHGNGPSYGTKNGQLRRASPGKPGWDRSYPLEPMPTTYEKNSRPVPAVNHRYANSRSRGVSLERNGGGQLNGDAGEMRRSKSHYQVANMAAAADSETGTLTAANGLKPKSMNSLVDDNQNNMIETRRTGHRFGYNPHGRSPSEPRFKDPALHYREDAEVANGNGANRRNHINQQTFRKVPASMQGNWSPGGTAAAEDAARAAALAAAEAAAETARKLEAEKLRIQMEAKKREQELMNTIRQQQLQLQRFQQAAALAEQKAKTAAAPPTPRTAATANVVTASKFRRPNADQGTKAAAAAVAADESDDSKSTMSDEVFASPSNKGWTPFNKRVTNEAPAEVASPKPKIPPKPAAAARQPVQRRSIFATAMAAAKEGLVACSICGRNFAADRIEKHESVCAKSKSKKRKVFDITKMRVKGTEAEGYVLSSKSTSQATGPRKHVATSSSGYQPPNPLTAYATTLSSAKPEPQPSASDDSKKSDWRKKHESFLETIRAAKAVTKHLKNGGKISDLPPPPPSDTSDYIQCPHCKRRFSPGAADRHIPKCANIKSNKPK